MNNRGKQVVVTLLFLYLSLMFVVTAVPARQKTPITVNPVTSAIRVATPQIVNLTQAQRANIVTTVS